MEQPTQASQRVVSHALTVVVFDVIAKSDNVFAFDAADLATAAENGKDQSLENALALADTAQALPFAGEIFFGNRTQRVGSGALCFLDCGFARVARIAALTDFVHCISSQLTRCRQRDAGWQRQFPWHAEKSIPNAETFSACRLDDCVKAVSAGIGDLTAHRCRFEVLDCDIG